MTQIPEVIQGHKPTQTAAPAEAPAPTRRNIPRTSLLARGEPMVWLTGGALVIAFLMIVGLLTLIIREGMSTFWPVKLEQLTTIDGDIYMGEFTRLELDTLQFENYTAKVAGVNAQAEALLMLERAYRDKVEGLSDDALTELLIAERATAEQELIRQILVLEGYLFAPLEVRRAIDSELDALFDHPDEALASRLVGTLRAALGADETGEALLELSRTLEQRRREWIAMDDADAMLNALRDDADIRYAVWAGSVVPQLRREVEVPYQRTLLRTANYDLNNTHYTWIADFERKVDSTTFPEWAVTIERLEWGRFYGMPVSLSVAQPREPSDAERTLKPILERLQRSGSAVSADQLEALAEARELVSRKLEQARTEATRAFIENTDARQGAQLLAGLPDPYNSGRLVTKPLDEVDPAEQDIVALVEKWSGAEAAWEQFQQFHPEVLDRRDRQYQIEKHDIGEVSKREEHARLDVRQAELDYGLRLIPFVNAIGQTGDVIEDLTAELRSLEVTMEDARTLFADRPELLAVIEPIETSAAAQLRQQIESLEAQRQQQWQKIRDQDPPETAVNTVEQYLATRQRAKEDRLDLMMQITEIKEANERYRLSLETADDKDKTLSLGEIVRIYPANQLGFGDKIAVYGSRWGEFLTADPREANQEGGVFPAIFGTVLMTMIMTIAVVPFGVLAALYIREYAKGGFVISVVRIAINNLAGVPSIVYGVFGLGFFCYIVGAYIDGGPKNLGLDTISPGLWITLLIVFLGSLLGGLGLISFVLTRVKTNSPVWARLGKGAFMFLWVGAMLVFAAGLLITVPFFDGLFEARLPNPTFGKGGLIWASLTLALLTLPVVIVATEEAVSAVPGSMREGSYACGASKWQTIRRIVLPRAMPGVITGMILAIARGAGEVAPLMLVGAVKLAPELPIAGPSEQFGVNRSFMHLGFHIFDLGFQSPNSEAAKPMVFTTTLLLITIVAALNIAAIFIRTRLRRKFQSSQF